MKPTRNLFVHILGLSLAACLTGHAITWDGGANNFDNWSGSGNGGHEGNKNWVLNNAPVASDPLIFAGTTRLTPNNNTTADTSYAGITFDNTAGTFVLGGNRITLGGDVINNDADLQTINMSLLLSGTRTFNAASGNLAVGGVIDDGASTFGLTKTGNGSLTLTAANTYQGDTTIKAGTLKLLSGGSLASTGIIVGDTGSSGAILDAIASSLVIASGQTVSGIGTIKGSTTIQAGGTISPGNSPGILTNLGNISLDPSSTFQAELNGVIAGTGYDQLKVTGASSIATLAGVLSVTTGFSPTNGNLFFLINNDGSSAISGVFSNGPVNGNTYTFGGSQQYAISYFGDSSTTSFTGGNDVVLKAVPEPGAALLGGLGGLFLLRRRRNA